MKPLSQRRHEFSQCVQKLLAFADKMGYRLVLDEGRVFKRRKGQVVHDGPHEGAQSVPFDDGIHIPNSYHYQGLAQDTVLYDDNWKPILSAHAQWSDLGAYWVTLHPNARWGGHFKGSDLNHFEHHYA